MFDPIGGLIGFIKNPVGTLENFGKDLLKTISFGTIDVDRIHMQIHGKPIGGGSNPQGADGEIDSKPRESGVTDTGRKAVADIKAISDKYLADSGIT